MKLGRLLSSSLLLALAITPCVAKTHRKTTSKPATKHTAGQRSIDDARAIEIQQALVRTGYMSETSGHWDSTTETAMRKYQSDNGWQTKLTPDSRAIIKLGLGPSQTNALASTASVSATQTLADTSADTNLSQR